MGLNDHLVRHWPCPVCHARPACISSSLWAYLNEVCSHACGEAADKAVRIARETVEYRKACTAERRALNKKAAIERDAIDAINPDKVKIDGPWPRDS